jgi:hypothetical protein
MKMQGNQLPFLVSGKFGDLIGRVINGKQFFSKKPRPSRRKPTMCQLETRRNMAIAIRFVRPITPLVRKYDEPNGRKGFNKITSHIIRNAIQGRRPDQRINYSQVVLGEGTLPNPDKYHVESPAKGLLELTWSLETLKRKLSKSDRIFAVAYCETRHQFEYELCGSERRERQFLMDVSRFSGQQIEVYFGFASSTGALVSTSVYAGRINVL